MTNNTVRAIRVNVNLGDFSFDAYELANGERRIGFAGTANVFGYADNWLGRLHKNESKQLKAIQAMGYSGLQKEVEVLHQAYGTRANTISKRDFTKLAVYEAIKKKNDRAIIILAAMAETGLDQTLDLAFAGKSLNSILSKIVHFSKWTHEEFMQALEDNREDVANLILGNVR
jgi:hypothetical protein